MYQYIVVRKELAGGALLAQVAHAAGESADKYNGIEDDMRVVVLAATKAQMDDLLAQCEQQNHTHAWTRILETDGPLTGSITAIGIVTRDRDALRAQVTLLNSLKVWR